MANLRNRIENNLLVERFDLVVLRLENENEYYVLKCRRYHFNNVIITEHTFQKLLKEYDVTLVMSDDKISLDELKAMYYIK